MSDNVRIYTIMNNPGFLGELIYTHAQKTVANGDA